MAEVVRTLPANADLLEIWAFLADDNIETANATLRAVGRKCLDCSELPGMGHRREDLAPNLRSIQEGSYIIFYRVAENGIQIVRVLHGARDLPGQFE